MFEEAPSSVSAVRVLWSPSSARRGPCAERLLALGEPLVGQGLTPLLDLLARHLRAHFVVFVRKAGRQKRTLVGRWADERDIGRADKLLPHALVKAVFACRATRWILDPSAILAPAAPPVVNTAAVDTTAFYATAGFRVLLEKPALGALVLGWRRAPTWLHRKVPTLDPRALSTLLAAVWTLEEAKSKGLRVPTVRPGSTVAALATHPSRSGLTAGEDVWTDGNVHRLFPEILGQSTAIREVLAAILRASRSDMPVLIEGESGTGKELVARAIHRASRRSDGLFVWENCGAIPENLVETEFFGHERGAFTGATEIQAGLFERASGGTVFLDEIGEMDPSMQKRLLRVLQEKEIRRVGGHQTLPVDFRVVSATNRVLDRLVAAGQFREDLYYRLNVAPISLPSLRERASDIPLLIQHFNEAFAPEAGRAPLQFSEEALAVLCRYGWPGNVRELRNEVLRLTSLEAKIVEPGMLSRRVLLHVRLNESSDGALNGMPLVRIEREVIGAAVLESVRQSGGNISEAARRLGITRSALYRRLRRYGLKADTVRDGSADCAATH